MVTTSALGHERHSLQQTTACRFSLCSVSDRGAWRCKMSRRNRKRTSRAAGHRGLLISRNSLFQIEKHALSAQRLAKWRTLNNGQHPRLQSDKPEQDPTVAISLLGFGQHFERCVFEIGNAAEIERDYFGLHLRNQGPDLVSDELGVREEHQAFHLQQQQARKGFILRVLLRPRSEHVGARFAPKKRVPVYH